MAAVVLAGVLVAGVIVLILNGYSGATGPNTVSLSGAVSLSQKMSPTCKLGVNQTIYLVSASFPDGQHQETSRYHYVLSFWIEAYHGPGTYLATSYVLDKVVLSHLAPGAGGRLAQDATYGMADRSGSATVDAAGLGGSIQQNLAGGAAGTAVHLSATWRCDHLDELSPAAN